MASLKFCSQRLENLYGFSPLLWYYKPVVINEQIWINQRTKS
ncbi:hypothetical protein [Wolbachia endosymbiont of Madathamugadia hiepei]|nr:hypothetical protein [Wolbachia endosymbiont of Madathamugadia hiepei]